VAGYKKIRYYTHENIGYGPVNLPDQELHTTAVWWQLPQAVLRSAFASRQDALDGFLGAGHALHVVATVAVMADARDLQKSVGNGDGAWFASSDRNGRGQLRGVEGGEVVLGEVQQFVPTVYLYDNFPGGVGLSEPLWTRQAELLARASELVERCDCRAGCPACVGPALAADEHEGATTPKSLARQVLALLREDAAA
jgi:DEAD/DEAH box helicase domain-containing protein